MSGPSFVCVCVFAYDICQIHIVPSCPALPVNRPAPTCLDCSAVQIRHQGSVDDFFFKHHPMGLGWSQQKERKNCKSYGLIASRAAAVSRPWRPFSLCVAHQECDLSAMNGKIYIVCFFASCRRLKTATLMQIWTWQRKNNKTEIVQEVELQIDWCIIPIQRCFININIPF